MLGGIWVALPDFEHPTRVVIRNTENGRSVVGVIYRDDLNRPGPKLQVSSDAAVALKMVAGQPAILDIVALVSTPPPTAAPQDRAEDSGDAAGSEANRTATDSPSAATTDGATDGTAVAGAVAAGSSGTAIAAQSAADDAAAIAIAETAAAAISQSQTVDAARADDTDTANTGTGNTGTGNTGQSTADQSPTGNNAPATATAQSPSNPYVQIGLFSIEDNARKIADQLSAKNLPARVTKTNSNDKVYWRVVVGPASDATTLKSNLTQVKQMGFSDAYLTRN
jgi:cell division septation protein DedD